MKQLRLTIVALFWLSTAAYGGSGNCLAAATSPAVGQHPAIDSTDPRPSGHIVQNANECAPDQAEAVWGDRSNLLGYSCYNNRNGS
jgi:hypothetical protein